MDVRHTAVATQNPAVDAADVTPDATPGSSAAIHAMLMALEPEQRRRVTQVLKEASPVGAGEHASLDPLELGRTIETAFGHAAQEAIAKAHAAGVAVAVAGDDGRLMWYHPDGTLRETQDG